MHRIIYAGCKSTGHYETYNVNIILNFNYLKTAVEKQEKLFLTAVFLFHGCKSYPFAILFHWFYAAKQ